MATADTRGRNSHPGGQAPPLHPADFAACICTSRTFPTDKDSTMTHPTSRGGGPSHGSAGSALIDAITSQLAEDGLTPDARDRAMLDTAARLVDRMATLEAMIETDGERTTSTTGVVRLHPAIAEHRNHAVALAKVLAAIALHETTGAAKDPAKVRAAQTRWRSHNLAKAAAGKDGA